MKKLKKIALIAGAVILVIVVVSAVYRYNKAKPQDQTTDETVAETAVAVPGQVEKQYLVSGPGLKFDQFVPGTPVQHATWKSKLDSASGKNAKPVDLKFLGLPAGTKIDSFWVKDINQQQNKTPEKSTWQKAVQWLKGHWYWLVLTLLAVVVVVVVLIYKRSPSSGTISSAGATGRAATGTATGTTLVGRSKKLAASIAKLAKSHYLYYFWGAICFLAAAYFVPSSPVNASMILTILGCFLCSMGRNFKDAQKFTSDAAKLSRYWKARLSLPILKIYAFLAIVWLALMIGLYLRQKGAPL